MYKKLALIVFILAFMGHSQYKSKIIPAPNSIVLKGDSYTLSNNTTISINNDSLANVCYYLKNELLKYAGLTLSNAKSNGKSHISLELISNNKKEGSYELKVGKNLIQLKANTLTGAINGVHSLLQLLITNNTLNTIKIPTLAISDEPAYPWRGLMLDTSRYFISKEEIKNIINWMALYKLNKLHLHLTDEPSWRIEIKKYPKLTTIGAIGNHNNPTAPAKYYTQEDIQEIIRYAKDRFIEVIPEIDMPGHATAANKAYPEYSGGGSEKHPEFTFNPGKKETYGFLTDILKEVHTLFPSNMIHLGGDEVSFGNQKWKSNSAISSLMKKNKLTDLKSVEHYFMERMADSLYKMDATLLAWDELADADFPRDKTILMWWRHDKPKQLNKALNKGYKTIICPRVPFYFDFIQDETHQSGRKWAGEFSTLEKLYHFNINNWVENPENKKYIIGFQANLWTETITSDKRLEFMIFPRIAALAEAAWTKKREDYLNFQNRLKSHLNLYKGQNIYYFNPFYPNTTPEPI